MILYKQLLLSTCLASIGTFCQAQVSVQKQPAIQKTVVRLTRQSDESAPITNQVTGKRITMEDYSQLTKTDPFAYHLVPDYNEYGIPGAYTMRSATPEEHETHRFRDRDPAKQPKAGQPIAPFAMVGLGAKTYRSADLLGKVVILSFWVSLDKSVWDDKQATEFVNALRPYQSEAAPIVLGVFNSEQPKEVDEASLKKLPFAPIFNAYGFHNKYHITTIPTFVVIDKTGKVVANLQGAGSLEKLKQVLATVTQ
ncbi:thioredoxin fold domain-containing protein [Spirosoma sp. HMF3257]|uniref:Thioredoxin domain-containing protein n=1 Tax=Spirosoma telluris TaxID=2183553 RepID=A0A327NUK9_9BACT|nr:thioredoxin fold domain-containing protein [Spirosoma telluris]RAI78119.1 hypothetical protein HMF3257_35770 [Spirosoma telluris]